MVKGKVIFEDEEKIEIKYPCFELKDIVEYYFRNKNSGQFYKSVLTYSFAQC